MHSVEEEIKRVIAMQEVENVRLKQLISEHAQDVNAMQQQHLALAKKSQEQVFVIGHADAEASGEEGNTGKPTSAIDAELKDY